MTWNRTDNLCIDHFFVVFDIYCVYKYILMNLLFKMSNTYIDWLIFWQVLKFLVAFVY